jgi:hypothetical protein
MAWQNRNVRKRKRPGGGGVGIRLDKNGTGEQEEYSVESDILLLPSMDHDDIVGKEDDSVHPKEQRRIRVVKPYPFTFATFAKARWNGRTVLDVYCDEFGSYPKVSFLFVMLTQ